ncbi:MAG: acylphosphatase [Methanothrix sp.]|nr:acylphosphatase [Methanothrix sp.]
MIRLTAHVSGRVQRVGYRAKVVALANGMGLVGIIQNRPDGRVLVIAEGEKKDDLERFASAIAIKNALIQADNVDVQYSQGSGQYSTFRKITGPDEVGERLDDGVEILKEMLIDIRSLTVNVNNLTNLTEDGFKNITTITEDGFKNLTTITEDGFKNLTTITEDGFKNLGGKMDQMLDRQEETIEEVRGLRLDLKSYMDRRFKRIEADLAELKEMKTALKEKGLI